MATLTSKRTKADSKILDKTKTYSISEAIKILKSATKTKFDPSVEVQCKLGVDLTANDQVVRGTTVLPHGRGKMPKVIVFSKDESSKAAKEAGADLVGGDDLVEKVMAGWLDFDVAISTPTMMKDVGKLGKVLGPRGLMPSPKAGTVTDNPAKAVKEIKSGRIEFKMDKQGNVHTGVGKLSFAEAQLLENTNTLIEALLRAKPKSAKGALIKSIHMSSTMGPGVRIDISKFLKETEATED